MSSQNNDEIISIAKPHTIKKFELIESYVKTWAQKLLQNQFCEGIIYIDCMSNSGVYNDTQGNRVFGSPIRVANILRDAAGQYGNQTIPGAEYYARSSPSLQQRAGTEQKLWGAGSPQRLHTD